MKYCIYIDNQMIAEVSGSEASYVCFEAAMTIAEMTGRIAHLVNGETGEVLTSSDDYDDYDPDYEPDYDECGFDPYEGCYTGDC